ncbi:MAG: DUF1501 domain-containing protein, partial [Verrucomicrobiota bacterium]|nr:DUF1501 domain-containing protein [Verrucomicrobiota bacterium]
GWDVSSYCDPKINQPGEKKITNWSKNNDVQQVGNIPFAAFANNTTFFEKYYRDMLVINGVDMQTNSHDTGIIHNWSGRNSAGFPTLTAMFAANNAPEQPLSYINFGGFGHTGNLIRFSRLADVSSLQRIIRPEENGEGRTFRNAGDVARIRAAAKARLGRQLSDTTLTPRQFETLSAHQHATASRSTLAEFSEYLPSSDEIIADKQVIPKGRKSSLQRQIQLTVAAFDAGLASASDLYMHGFDTHNDHDATHKPLLNHLNESIDLLWTLAETANIADRLTVIIGSDFGRTPHYNEDSGKDHWAIGSVIVMEKSPSWGNRVIGSTDEMQNAHRINPKTMQRDDANGTNIYPKHVHKALRRHLELENTAVDQNFKLLGAEDFDFFG